MPQRDVRDAVVETNGERLAGIRRRRRWNQERLARESGYSLSAVKKFEQGRRSLDRADVILAFCKALDCHPTEITGQPYAPAGSDREGQTAVSAVAAVRRALLRHGRPARPTEAEAAAVDLAELRRRVADANRLRQGAALPRMAEVLPALLRDLQVAAEVCPAGPSGREVFDLLAQAYECAMQYLYKLGHIPDATLATERVLWSAERTENPLRVLAARWYDAGEFLAIGEHDEAADIIDRALVELGTVRRGPEVVALTGAFHLKGALNAARATDGKEAERHLEKAKQAAADLGEDRNDFELMFGPTNVAIWSVSLPVEMGRGRDAVDAAGRITLPPEYSTERRTQFLIDKGRAHFYNGEVDRAFDSFLEAERLAPQQTRMNAAVKETVRVMRRTRCRGPHEQFAMRLGVA